jgi:hypothetical protein
MRAADLDGVLGLKTRPASAPTCSPIPRCSARSRRWAAASQLPAGAGHLYLHDLAVAPRAHGCGLGRRLVQAMLARIARSGLAHSALVSVQASRRFWESFGYMAAPEQGAVRYWTATGRRLVHDTFAIVIVHMFMVVIALAISCHPRATKRRHAPCAKLRVFRTNGRLVV